MSARIEWKADHECGDAECRVLLVDGRMRGGTFAAADGKVQWWGRPSRRHNIQSRLSDNADTAKLAAERAAGVTR